MRNECERDTLPKGNPANERELKEGVDASPLARPNTIHRTNLYEEKSVALFLLVSHTQVVRRYYYAGFQHKDYVPLFPSTAQFVISSTRFSVATANEHVSIWGRSALPTTPNCRRRRVVRNSATRGGSRVVQTRIAGSRIRY